MNVKQDEQKNLNDNFFQAQYRTKQLISHNKEEKEKQTEKILAFFKAYKKSKLFEQTPTIVQNYNNHTGPNIDFSFYKLNLDFLKISGIYLEEITTSITASDSSSNIMYSEYYVDRMNGYIFWLKYYFKHVRIYSDNGKTDVFTYTFVNDKVEICYYDELTGGCKVLKKCNFNMNISYAQELIKGKTFEVKPYKNRTYEIVSDGNLEKMPLSDIHLVFQKLLDILLAQSKDAFIPLRSKIMIETKLLGTSKISTVQTEVTVNYKYSGVIQTTEKLLKYEISLYFKGFPEEKVTAYFYLTKAEKHQKFAVTDEWLEKIVLNNVNEKLKKDNYCENFYKKFLINKSDLYSRDSALKGIAEIFYKNMCVTNSFVEFPKLEDTYKGIYIEHFTIEDNAIKYHFPFAEQISASKLEYDKKFLKQTMKYAVLYEDELYLLEICVCYHSYTYIDSTVFLLFPAFVINDIDINVFKPMIPEDVDTFVDSIKCQKLEDKFSRFNSYNYQKDIQRDEPINNRNWQNIFPDFVIQTAGKRENYKVVSVNSNTIYQKILDCITTLRAETSNFSFSKNYPFGFCDDEENVKKVPLISNDMEYGSYFDDGLKTISVNTPMRENCDYTYSSGDDLIKVVFDDTTPYYKTTFYALLEYHKKALCRDSEIKVTSYRTIGEDSFWNECIEFLIHMSEKNTF